MARKPTTIDITPVEVTDILPAAQEIVRATDALEGELQSRAQAIAAQIGYQLPVDSANPDLIQRDIAANLRRSVEACLEVGRGLCVLKVVCGHGNFMGRLEALGLDAHVASRFMGAARKFSNLPSNANLLKAIGSQTKLFEMLVLDDEQIEELAETGQTGSLVVDDVATMSVKELRRALREAKADKEATSRLMADKNAKIDELATKLSARQSVATPPAAPADIAEQLRHALLAQAGAAEVTVLSLRQHLAALRDHGEAGGLEHAALMAGAVAQVRRAVDMLVNQFDLAIEPLIETAPAWLQAGGTVSSGVTPPPARGPDTVDWIGGV